MTEWKLELQKLDGEASKEHQEILQEFDQLCKGIGNLEGPIIISRNQTTTTKKTPLQLVKELRKSDDYMGVLISNIYIKRLKDGKHENVGQSQEKTVYDDDVNILYKNIMDGQIEINSVDDQGKTALYMAVEKDNAYGVELLLIHGASVMQKYLDKKTAIEFAVDNGNEDITKLIWKEVKGEEGRNQLFYHLCDIGNKKAIEFILEHSNKEEKQEMIEWDANENKRFPPQGAPQIGLKNHSAERSFKSKS